MKFEVPSNGKYNVTGLTQELESIYIDDIYKSKDSDILVVVNSIYEANKIYNSLINYNANVYLFPMDDFVTSEASISSPELMINRIETINSVVFDKTKKIIISNLMGVLRFLPLKKIWKDSLVNISVNSEVNKEKLFRKLNDVGYNVETLVTKTGEISNRGYILDIFPVNEENPIRIEFWGDVIESIRYFNIDTQLSYENINEIDIYPFSEFLTDTEIKDEDRKQKNLYKYGKISKLDEYLNDPIIIYKDYNQIYNSYIVLGEEIANYKEINNEKGDYLHNLEEISGKCEIYISSVDILQNVKVDECYNYDSHAPQSYNDNFEQLNKDLELYISLNKTVIICLKNEHQVNNVIKYINLPSFRTNMNNIKESSINVIINPINEGYIIDNYIVLAESNLFKFSNNVSMYKSKFKYGTKITNADALNIGDYVVHNIHGIGMYVGIVALKKGSILKDYLQIKYKDDGKLYIPVERIELISKYSSNEGVAPNISRLGGTEWQKTKMRVRGRLHDIADELLKIAAERKLKKGFAFKRDTEEQAVFESEFTYDETDDQIKAIKIIKEAMENPSPMDILLCGDVGYGKTEVAFRAMFKAICSNKQVAYLCPTTILSNQQYISALSRFKNFPINIALLNRFTTKSEIEKIISKLKNGQIDIVFGTHRLLSNDVEFKDLGLLVVDEEQRFGVTHKEKIKKYKSNIDILTLSATPIPRTLQMSMVGIRDLVLIETPPRNRYPIQTYVLEENPYLIKDAIYKELSRNGQVYILCNRIDLFNEKIRKITDLVPDAKIGYIHGKMNKSEIEDIMLKFVNKEYNLLLCTTIIETGIDIPNVNTLIIFDADKFGLSQLYQIRGRVGRTDRIAYAYLMHSKQKVLSEIAFKRLSAIKEFTQLGSGFSIAKRDLSIRGAGDVIGQEQSGFIDTIGVELYIKMLNEEVNKLKGIYTEEEETEDVPILNVETHIDDLYVSDDKLKIEIHKMISQIDSYESLVRIKTEIEDRFGKINDKMLIYMYEEWFENLKDKKGIEKAVQTDKTIELIFDEYVTKNAKVDEMFVKAYQISTEFKISYENRRIKLILKTNNLERHWIFYIVDLLNNL